MPNPKPGDRLDRTRGALQAIGAIFTWRFIGVLSFVIGCLCLLSGKTSSATAVFLMSCAAGILSLKEGEDA